MSIILDEAVECVKSIVNNNRCATCDSLSGERVRYKCGHGYCDDCVAKVEHCLLCLTPPGAALQPPLADNPAAHRACNAATLLKTFQEAFNVDVYKRSRISEQQKLEKEVFPDCIQAPVKYHNKRKSSILLSNKENKEPSFYPGELISPVKAVKMENSFNYIRDWLENNDKKFPNKSTRKPFADLNVNSLNTLKRGIPKRADLILGNVKELSENIPKKRRKSSFDTSLTAAKSQSVLNNYSKPLKGNKFQKIKRDLDESSLNVKKVIKKSDKDESGIVMDDEPIVIDDSPSQIVDKDKLAWLAVLEAPPYVSQNLLECSDLTEKNNVEKLKREGINHSLSSKKVPFFKRGYLTESCSLCRTSNFDKLNVKNQDASTPKDISITIESNSFLTSIKVSTVKNNPVLEKHSISVQTDVCESTCSYKENIKSQETDVKNKLSTTFDKVNPKSIDLFTAEIEEHQTKILPKVTNEVIIADSDSDDAANESSIIHVTAEIHRSSEQNFGVLSELEQSDIQQRATRNVRGRTPNSTDSSDKENFDPNRLKKTKQGKKLRYKKDVK